MSNYTAEVLSLDDQVARIGKIFKKNENPKSEKLLRWQYSECPAGAGITTVSVFDASVDAAIYSIFPVEFKSYGESGFAGAQSLDTLTDSDHRGKGLFLTVARENYRAAASKGIDFIYGFPNQYSAPGFFNKLGWVQLGAPPFRIFVANILYPIKRKFGFNLTLKNYLSLAIVEIRLRVICQKSNLDFREEIDFSSNEYRELWNGFSYEMPFAIDRSSSYMDWRYKSKPFEEYKYVSVFESGRLAAVCIYACKEKHGGSVGYIMDLIYDKKRKEIGDAALMKATMALSSLGADVILAWADIRHDVNLPYVSAQYFLLPRRLQPIKLFFGAIIINKKIKNNDLSGMYISYADSDTV